MWNVWCCKVEMTQQMCQICTFLLFLLNTVTLKSRVIPLVQTRQSQCSTLRSSVPILILEGLDSELREHTLNTWLHFLRYAVKMQLFLLFFFALGKSTCETFVFDWLNKSILNVQCCLLVWLTFELSSLFCCCRNQWWSKYFISLFEKGYRYFLSKITQKCWNLDWWV